MMSITVKHFLKARRDRALGAILGHAERNIWPKLDKQEREALRQVVLDALNGYHDTVLDLVKSESADVVRNEEVLNLLQSIERRLPERERPPVRT